VHNTPALQHLTDPVIAVLASATAVSLPLAILLGRDQGKLRRLYTAALRNDTLECFEPHSVTDSNPILVSPRAELVVCEGDEWRFPPARVLIRQVARAPRERTGELANYAHLKPEELEEIRQHVRAARVRFRRWLIGYTLFSAYALLALVASLTGAAARSGNLPSAFLTLFLWSGSTWWLIKGRPLRSRRVARQLSADLLEGYATCIDGSEAVADYAPDILGLADDSVPTRVWLLAHSGIPWEIDNVPAPWRRG